MGLRFVIYAILIVLSMALVYKFDIGYTIGFIVSYLLLIDIFNKFYSFTFFNRVILGILIFIAGLAWNIDILIILLITCIAILFKPINQNNNPT